MKNDFGNKRAAFLGFAKVTAILSFFMAVLKPGKLGIELSLLKMRMVLNFIVKKESQAAYVYFSNLFTSNQSMNIDFYFEDRDSNVTPVMNNDLTREISDEEIQLAAFSIGSDRAPGPDGMNGAFYQQYWSIVGATITQEIRSFFDTGILKQLLNHTNIVLIPKKKKKDHKQ